MDGRRIHTTSVLMVASLPLHVPVSFGPASRMRSGCSGSRGYTLWGANSWLSVAYSSISLAYLRVLKILLFKMGRQRISKVDRRATSLTGVRGVGQPWYPDRVNGASLYSKTMKILWGPRFSRKPGVMSPYRTKGEISAFSEPHVWADEM